MIPTTEPAAATFADLVAGVDASTDAELTARFRQLESQRRAVEAEMATIVDRVERRGAHRGDGHRTVSGWIRAHTNCAAGRATRLGRLGRLIGVEATVGEDLWSGRIGVDQAVELGRAHANPRCGVRIGESLPLLLGHAHRLKFDEFRLVVHRWEILADVDGAHRDRGDALRARRVLIAAGSDGVDLAATGGTAIQAAGMAAILEAFTRVEFDTDLAAARERLGDDVDTADLARTDAQRRFDALVNIFHAANRFTGEATPPEVTVNVVVDLYTFEEQLARHGLADPPVDLPRPDPAAASCHTDRGVPVLPHDVVAAALDGWVRRRVITTAGVTVDLGHRSRLFTGAAAEAARMAVTRCELPGCAIPADRCQIDHLTEWGDHGPTDQDNAGVACGHHNRHKHRHRLTVRRDRHGQLRVQRPDRSWMDPVGVDPPHPDDFTTREQIHQRLRAEGFQLWYRTA